MSHSASRRQICCAPRAASAAGVVAVVLVVASTAFSVTAAASTGTAAGHDDTYVYRLPYRDGVSFSVLQAYGSRFSHRGTEHYTLDFRMSEGTPVLSARDGVVIEADGTHSDVCWAEGCGRLGNRVIVRHDDGTLAKYFHLAPNSIRVEVGERIERGRLIALSGNTGLSTTPHLHFGVYVLAADGNLQSIPVRFATSGGATELRQGRRYRHPSAASFAGGSRRSVDSNAAANVSVPGSDDETLL